MNGFVHHVARVRTLSFDCYGTLIDWKKGLGEAITSLLGPSGESYRDPFYAAYVDCEAKLEAGPYRCYREIVTDAAREAASRLGIRLHDDQAGHVPLHLPTWKPFADTNGALARLQSRFRLGVLSNIDRDLFAGTADHFDIEFDFVVTAEDVRAYKPNVAHFQRLFKDHADRETHLHVAQSLFHDGEPCAQLGIPFVWINRYDDVPVGSAKPLAVFRDLHSLAIESAP
ncbi:MAG: HAD-IA family hydrolase [Planctomycetota bacterium]